MVSFQRNAARLHVSFGRCIACNIQIAIYARLSRYSNLLRLQCDGVTRPPVSCSQLMETARSCTGRITRLPIGVERTSRTDWRR